MTRTKTLFWSSIWVFLIDSEKYGELTFAQKTIIESLTEVVDFKLFEEENEADIEQKKIYEELELEK